MSSISYPLSSFYSILFFKLASSIISSSLPCVCVTPSKGSNSPWIFNGVLVVNWTELYSFDSWRRRRGIRWLNQFFYVFVIKLDSVDDGIFIVERGVDRCWNHLLSATSWASHTSWLERWEKVIFINTKNGGVRTVENIFAIVIEKWPHFLIQERCNHQIYPCKCIGIGWVSFWIYVLIQRIVLIKAILGGTFRSGFIFPLGCNVDWQTRPLSSNWSFSFWQWGIRSKWVAV